MINLLWPQVTGRRYQDLTDKQKKLGNNLMVWWQACVECGQCEEKCPYNLPIIKRKQELMHIFSEGK
jgi:NAD-dependent dihydropyrimidine dehydrogenase PreA subunit